MNDRRKPHPKESKKIEFWKDNKLDGHYRKSMGMVIADFLLSKEETMHREGMPFGRCILGYMSRYCGTFDIFENNELEDLKEIYKCRIKEMEG